MLFVGVFAYGQNSTTVDKELGYTTSWYKFTEDITTDDNINAMDSVWTYVVFKNSYKPVKYDIYVDVDSISGTAESVNFILESKKWLDDASWTAIDTVVWSTGVDTVFTYTTSTATQNQYFRFRAQGADNTFVARIMKLFFKFWE